MSGYTVAVQPGLEQYATVLKQAGFAIVDPTNTTTNLTAMVYSSDLNAGKFGQQMAGLRPEDTFGGGGSDGYVLMLDAAELQPNEVLAKIMRFTS